MNVRKAGLTAAGTLAAMFALSPLASAAELPQAPTLPDLPSTSATAPEGCTFTGQGNDASSSTIVPGDNSVNTVPEAPVAGDVGPTFGQCSTYGNHNGEGNGEGALPGQSSPGSGFGGGVL